MNTDTPPIVRTTLRRYTVWVIYNEATEFAVRRWSNYTDGVLKPDIGSIPADSLAEARGLIPLGKHNMKRQPDDAPEVKEHWL